MLPRLVHLDELLVVLLLCLFFVRVGSSDDGSGGGVNSGGVKSDGVNSGGVSSIEDGTRWVREAVVQRVHALAFCVDHTG